MKRVLAGMALLAAVALTMQGCGKPSTSKAIRIKGSDTMVNLGQAWVEAYRNQHRDADFSVSGGGSAVGITALINGDTEIAESSRAMKPAEWDQSRQKGLNPSEITVARDGLSVIVNKSNPVSKLTIGQLSDIYTGKITNWKEVGGNDAQIVALSRDKSSGSHDFFLEHVVRKGNAKGRENFENSVLMLISSSTIAKEVANNKDGIGYVGMGYVDKTKHKEIAVAKDVRGPFVEPTEANVLNNTYPIARPLYFYTPNEPAGGVKTFIDFVLGNDGQKIVKKLGFVPVKAIK